MIRMSTERPPRFLLLDRILDYKLLYSFGLNFFFIKTLKKFLLECANFVVLHLQRKIQTIKYRRIFDVLKILNTYPLTFGERRNPHGIVADMLNINIIISEFELQSHYHIHFFHTFEKGKNLVFPLMNLLIPHIYGVLNSTTTVLPH